MAVKAVNNTIGLDRLVPILLVFSTYLRLTDRDTPLLSVLKRGKAVRIVIKEIRQLYIER